MHALIGAYSQDGHEWTDELNQVLESNCRYAVQYIQDHFPGCQVSLPQGTYMLFVECGEYLKANQMTLPELLKKAWDVGVAWQDGRKFAWKDAMRLNLALPRTRLEEAMRRLSEYVF